MKPTSLLTLLALGMSAVIANAGPMGDGKAVISKNPVPPAPPVYGLGWYGAIDGGVNLYQSYGSGGNVTVKDVRFSYEPDSRVGGFVGGKLGYVFGADKIRPAVEFDGYYNGFQSKLNISSRFNDDSTLKVATDSGAFLINALARFDFGRFQPYVGAGAGFYYLSLDNPRVTVNGNKYYLDQSTNNTNFAWQIVAGADYYFTEKVSGFLEYKFLNYEGLDSDLFSRSIRQQLLGVGVRVHF